MTNTATTDVKGRCYCDSVQVSIAGGLRAPINCHCTQCRRLSGAAFTTWFSVRRASLTVIGESSLADFAPTANLSRRFCATCGTHVLTLDRRHPDIAGIPAGLLEGNDLPAPESQYFVDDKAPWFQIPGGARCFGGATGFEPMPPSSS